MLPLAIRSSAALPSRVPCLEIDVSDEPKRLLDSKDVHTPSGSLPPKPAGTQSSKDMEEAKEVWRKLGKDVSQASQSFETLAQTAIGVAALVGAWHFRPLDMRDTEQIALAVAQNGVILKTPYFYGAIILGVMALLSGLKRFLARPRAE